MLARKLLATYSVAANATIAYKTSAVNQSALSQYTFNLTGAFEAGLCVLVVTSERASGTGRTLSSVSFGGNSATPVVNTALNNAGGGTLVSAIYAIRLASLVTDPSVVASFSGGAMSRAAIACWILQNVPDSADRTASLAVDGASSSISNTLSSVSSNSVGVSVVTSGNYQTSNTWTNATARVVNIFTTGTMGSFADFQVASSGDYVITSNSTANTGDGQILVSAAWA